MVGYCKKAYKKFLGLEPVMAVLAVMLILGAASCTGSKENVRGESLITSGTPFGLVYAGGEYHIFYEHADTIVEGRKYWSHQVSKDLLRWEQRPSMFAGSSNLFSGCVVDDCNNSSGLGSKGNPPMMAYYSVIDRENKTGTHYIAYSIDQGVTWTQYDQPVLETPGDLARPKVFWHEKSSRWIMSLAGSKDLNLYASVDGLHWNYLSSVSNIISNQYNTLSYELFPMPVEGTDWEKWLLLVSNEAGAQYYVGDFDGNQLKMIQIEADHSAFMVDYGKDFQNAITCRNAPDNKKIVIGWKNRQPAAAKSWFIPRELRLVKDESIYLLQSVPVDGMNRLYGKKTKIGTVEIRENQKNEYKDVLKGSKSSLINVSFDNAMKGLIGAPSCFGVELRNADGAYFIIKFDNDRNVFIVDQSDAPEPYSVLFFAESKVMDWKIFVSANTIEFFDVHNRISMTNLLTVDKPFEDIIFFSEGGPVKLSCNIALSQF